MADKSISQLDPAGSIAGTEQVPVVQNGTKRASVAALAPVRKVAGRTGDVTLTADDIADSADRLAMTAAERSKLSAVAAQATKNATDAQLRDRGTHTGQQPSTSISDFTEAVQDAVAALLQAGTGVTVTYDDPNNKLTLTVTGTGGTTDPEVVRDTIGVALQGLGLISVTVNDAADTIAIATTATQNATDAALRDRSTHTGTQPVTSIADLAEFIRDTAGAALVQAGMITVTVNDAGDTITIGTSVTAAQLRDRSTHTGTQAADTISGLSAWLETALAASPAYQALLARVADLEGGTSTPIPSTTRYLIANFGEGTMPQSSTATGTVQTQKEKFTLHQAADELEFIFRNAKVNADGTTTGAINIPGLAMVIQKPGDSTFTPVLFDGVAEKALAVGAHASAVITGSFPAGDYVIEKRLKSDAAGGGWPGSNASGAWYNGAGKLDSDVLGQASADFGQSFVAGFRPLAILGKLTSGTRRPAVLLYADSIGAGDQDADGAANGQGDRGGFSKGLTAAGVPHVRWTVPSMSIAQSSTTAARANLKEAIQLSGATHLLFEMGINELIQNPSITLDAFQALESAQLAWLRSEFPSLKIIMTTLLPGNGSGEAVRKQINAARRAKYHSAIDGVWDVSPQLETAADSGTWKSGLSGDNIHPNTDGHAALATFIQARGTDLRNGLLEPSTSTGGGGTEAAGGWVATGSNGASSSGDTATLSADGPSGIYAAKSIAPGEKKIFVMRVDEYGDDGSLGLAGQGTSLDRWTDGFASTESFVLAPFRGASYINGAEHQSFSGLGLEFDTVEMWADRTTSGVLKVWWKGSNTSYNLGERSDAGHQGANPTTGVSPIEVPIADSTVLLPFGQNGYGHSSSPSHYVLNETAASFADLIPTIPSGWTSWAGGTGGTSTGGSTSSSDTSGGTSYVTPSGAGDGADGAYTFGTTAVADPVASRSRLRVATTPLKAGSGATETFWAHDYFSVQGVNVNLMEEVNRDRITFVTGFLKHLRPALIRVALTSTDTTIINMYKALCDAVGCKMVFQGMSFNDYSESTMAQKAAACVARVKALGGSDYIAWLEGMNEVDLNLWRFGAANNASAISMMVDMHTRCYDALKADSATSGILIAAPSCTGTNGQVSTDVNTAITGMSTKYDAGNARWYSGKWEPNMPSGGVDGNGYGTIDYEIAKARATANGKVPVVITECGYHNGILNVNDPSPHLPVREDTASLYFPDIFTMPYMKGARVVTSYQVSDFSTSGANQTDKHIDQENFGLLRFGDRSVKPGGITLARYNAKLRDDVAAPTMVAIPPYTLGNAANVLTRNFMKANGQYLISMRDGRRAVNVDTEVWRNGTRTSPFNPNALLIYPQYTATINFGSKTWSKVEWYNVHLDTTDELTKDGSGNYSIPMSQKTGLLILTP
ncbi:SGNH/GDSL hydrolase family protein [Roseomonas mucosa]|uniref:SGNH/GDSL hydrolase family protein n=1 Tax=Roseomonas mucosa TaxID=207340 RepID=UPI001EF57D2E|nr:SGNH/GDSL hydrolase family protein [Roseomonas mucosa]MCG7357097.1 SGNH/GDSL hydrolase family protein [Roseomonas mucosa]